MPIVDGYATLDEVKSDLRLLTTKDDERLERVIEAASRTIDGITHRRWSVATDVRMFSSAGTKVWVDDATAVATVQESDDQATWAAVATTSYVVNPRPPIRSLTRIDGLVWRSFVRMTGAPWGTAVIPPDVNQACRIQSVRLFKRADTPEGILQGDFGAARLSRIDPDVLQLLRPYVRVTGIA